MYRSGSAWFDDAAVTTITSVKLRSFVQHAPNWARYDTWNVGVATLDRPLTDVRQLSVPGPIRWLPARPSLRFVADPFPYRDLDGHEWLLPEDDAHRKGER